MDQKYKNSCQAKIFRYISGVLGAADWSISGTVSDMKAKKPSADRHDKKSKMVRIRAEFMGPLLDLKKRRATGVTQIVNDAVRKELEGENLWPGK